MSITAERKQALIKEYATTSGDTGSPEVQIAMLTHRIEELTAHLTSHLFDHLSHFFHLTLKVTNFGITLTTTKSTEAPSPAQATRTTKPHTAASGVIVILLRYNVVKEIVFERDFLNVRFHDFSFYSFFLHQYF